MKKQIVVVTSGYERFVHWLMAISCLLLCYTGLGMMYKELNFFGAIFGGLKGLKTVHDICAVFFAVGLLLAIQMWWKEAGVFVFPEDWEWIKAGGDYLWHVDHVPETGKYNPGQKMFFLTVALCGLLMICTGFFMWFPHYLPANLMDWVYVLHVLGFVVIFAFFFVHLYLGTIGNPGSVSAMFSGKMELPVLRMLHPKWVKEMEHEGKLMIVEDKK
ncbi:MAG: formate dehydrogenase subunit gamma [Deltaproteobacteria bacterium]|nr:formate dehydrogenase subunit gamma [Deltaproteobacteria bacterium]